MGLGALMATSRESVLINVTQARLMKAMRGRGYRKHTSVGKDLGICDGLAAFAEIAVLSSQINRFLAIYQCAIDYSDSLEYYEVPIEEVARTVDHFSRMVEFANQWYRYRSIFANNDRDPIKRRRVIRQMMAGKDWLPICDTVELAQPIVGVYAQDDFIPYLKGLRFLVENVEALKSPICFTLAIRRHVFLLAYMPAQQQWYLVNGGQVFKMSMATDNGALATIIWKAFGRQKNTATITRISTSEDQLLTLSTRLQKLTEQPEWQVLHAPETQAKRTGDCGSHVLHLAAFEAQTTLVDTLIKFDESLCATRLTDGSTILHMTVSGRSADILQQFLRIDSKLINVQDQKGRTALYCAAEDGCEKMTKLLLAYGADVQLADINAKTPLDIAKKLKHQAVVDLLSQRDRCDKPTLEERHCLSP